MDKKELLVENKLSLIEISDHIRFCING